MNKRRLITVLVIIILWQGLALLINNDILIPLPWNVFKQMLTNIVTPSFYYTVLVTIVRMLKGLLVALVSALILGVLGGIYQRIADYFSIVNDIIKTIPNISYIIIVLIWLGSEGSVTVVTFFILFPGLYANILLGMNSLTQDLKDVMAIYPETLFNKIKKVYLPQIVPYLLSGLKVAFGLGFKVSVMAEILSQVRVGIGKQIYYARNMLDMTSIISWTLWIIVISLLVDYVFEKIIEHQKKDN